jgi:hypothetical protein
MTSKITSTHRHSNNYLLSVFERHVRRDSTLVSPMFLGLMTSTRLLPKRITCMQDAIQLLYEFMSGLMRMNVCCDSMCCCCTNVCSGIRA